MNKLFKNRTVWIVTYTTPPDSKELGDMKLCWEIFDSPEKAIVFQNQLIKNPHTAGIKNILISESKVK